VEQLQQHLCESLKLRILNVPIPPGVDKDRHVRVAILFSGGLDCTVLARMAHDLLPTEQQIDLINVAFENPRVVEASKKVPKPKKQARIDPQDSLQIDTQATTGNQNCISFYEACPDRETGRKAFQELQDVCPGRVWRFVAVTSLNFPPFFVSSLCPGQCSVHRNNRT
jgi:asparagine synthetase B (glutamine-hydrolysing)